MWRVASVRVRPGATTLARMPCGPSSSASDFVKASSADLALEWATKPGPGSRERVLLTLTMQPPPRRIMPGTTAWQVKKAAFSSLTNLRSKSSQRCSVKGAMEKLMEALLTRMSIGPSSASAARTMASTSSREVTSARASMARPPPAAMSAATFCA